MGIDIYIHNFFFFHFCSTSLFVFFLLLQPYQWLREKIMSEDGRKQHAKLKELAHIAEKLSCSLPQLAIGERRVKMN